jgi:ferredoxin
MNRIHGCPMDLPQLKRDARSLWQTLTGLHPPSFSVRDRVEAAPPAQPPTDEAIRANPEPSTPRGAEVTAQIDGTPWTFTVAPGQSILAAAQADQVPLRFSCTVGGCGACRIKLRSGEVDLDEPNCLSEEERAEGYVLCCVGHPRSESVELEGYQ